MNDKLKEAAAMLLPLGAGFIGGEFVHGLFAVLGVGLISGALGYIGYKKSKEFLGSR